MEYIASRGFDLPKAKEKWSTFFWFSMWERKWWPYEELLEGDIIYWYETPHQRLVLKSQVTKVDRFQYSSKDMAARRLREKFHSFDNTDEYFIKAPHKGFCLAWKAKPLQEINLDKPNKLKLPRLGWLRVNQNIATNWLKQELLTEEITIDDMVSDGSLREQLENLSEMMAEVSPERRQSIFQQTIRRDTKIIKTLKRLCSYRCQFPNCGTGILKKNGSYYVEVGHILPVSKGGKSVLGNLLVLCPNHHKEFDLGHREILEQASYRVKGRLNGKVFDISLPREK